MALLLDFGYRFNHLQYQRKDQNYNVQEVSTHTILYLVNKKKGG